MTAGMKRQSRLPLGRLHGCWRRRSTVYLAKKLYVPALCKSGVGSAERGWRYLPAKHEEECSVKPADAAPIPALKPVVCNGRLIRGRKFQKIIVYRKTLAMKISTRRNAYLGYVASCGEETHASSRLCSINSAGGKCLCGLALRGASKQRIRNTVLAWLLRACCENIAG